MPRKAKTVSEAQALIKPLVNKILTNKTLGSKAKIYKESLRKMGSDKATSQSVTPELHATAVANIDALYENAAFATTHPDAKKRPEIARVHRLGNLMYDEGSNTYIPVKITVLEYSPNAVDHLGGKLVDNVYSIEAIEVLNEGGVGRASTDGSSKNPHVPITDTHFNNKIRDLLEKVNSKSKNSENNSYAALKSP